MFQGLSQNAHKLLTVLGQNEAKRVNADFYQPEHILAALVKNKFGRAYELLTTINADIFNLELLIEQNIIARPGKSTLEEIPSSHRIKTIIDFAAIEARTMQHTTIRTEHLLIALAREDNSLLGNFFTKYGIILNDLRKITAALSPQTNWLNSSMQNQEKAKHKSSILMEFGKNLNDIIKYGETDPVIGRENEIKRLIQILSRRTKNNPLLLGEPGIGKTSIIEGLVFAITEEQVPHNLLEKKIISVDLGSIIAGTKYRGQFEDRLKQIINEIKYNKNIILFIDELHTIIGTGGSQGAMDAANILKPALARGEIQCIGATTTTEYRKYFQTDPALERRFQIINVKEPTPEETFKIICGIKSKYEEHHNVNYPDNVIKKIIEYSERYIPDRYFPDKAIDVLDEAGAMKKTSFDKRPGELSDIEEKIRILTKEKNELVDLQNYEKAALIRDEVSALKNNLAEVKMKWTHPLSNPAIKIEEDDIAKVISLMTEIPVTRLTDNERKKILNMESELKKNVIGQDEAISVISNSIRRARAGIASPDKPIGSFIFLGPTGVGKTLLAKSLAEFLFGTKDALIRIDMSDYMEKHNAARITGAPPGYVGFENGGFLTEKIRQNPYSVILLDEIEKAHPDVFNILLQILEEGELRDNRGNIVNFKNSVILMTSNAGSKLILNEQQVGFNSQPNGLLLYSEIKSNAINEIKKFLSPEFINRIDDILVFNPLSEDNIKQILDIQLQKIKNRLQKQKFFMEVSESAVNYFVKNGYEPAYGARPMRRLLQTKIEDKLAEKIINEEISQYGTAIVDFNNNSDDIVIEIIESPHKKDAIIKEETVRNLADSQIKT